jgi:hypothetical protein
MDPMKKAEEILAQYGAIPAAGQTRKALLALIEGAIREMMQLASSECVRIAKEAASAPERKAINERFNLPAE